MYQIVCFTNNCSFVFKKKKLITTSYYIFLFCFKKKKKQSYGNEQKVPIKLFLTFIL